MKPIIELLRPTRLISSDEETLGARGSPTGNTDMSSSLSTQRVLLEGTLGYPRSSLGLPPPTCILKTAEEELLVGTFKRTPEHLRFYAQENRKNALFSAMLFKELKKQTNKKKTWNFYELTT